MTDSSPRLGSRRGMPRRRSRVAGTSRPRWVQLGLVFIAAALIVNSLIGERGLLEAWRVQREHDELAASIGALSRENARLTEAIRRLREDPKAIEDEARKDLGLIRPGEVVFVVKDVPANAAGREPPRSSPR